MKNIYIAPNFSTNEAGRTDRKGFKTMNLEYALRRKPRVALLGQTILQPIRKHINLPMRMNSWVRCPELNTAVGGVKWSDHLTGGAADWWPVGMNHNRLEMLEVFDSIRAFLREDGIMFGQIILEEKNTWKGTSLWFHISQGVPFRDLKKCGEVWRYFDKKYTFIEQISFPDWK